MSMHTGRCRWLLMVVGLLLPGCPLNGPPGPPINPFRDLSPVTLDGRSRPVETDVVPLGAFNAGDVLELRVDGPRVKAVLILTEDPAADDAGLLAGGGRGNTSLLYRVQRPGRYFAYIQFDPQAPPAERTATLSAGFGDPTYRPPARQVVQVAFEPGFLSEPGLFDPVGGTAEDQALLAALSEQVRAAIEDYLKDIFADTPIIIVTEDEPLPQEPVSRLIYRSERVLSDDQDRIDTALPPPDPTRPQCSQRVLFGELLPEGTEVDPGNSVLDDEAVVYVGSLQGRGRECWTSVINSVNNIILTLAQVGVHEIGHLIGLYHVTQFDLMNPTATIALQRELSFARGQIEIEQESGGRLINVVVPTLIQDPSLYFETNFER